MLRTSFFFVMIAFGGICYSPTVALSQSDESTLRLESEEVTCVSDLNIEQATRCLDASDENFSQECSNEAFFSEEELYPMEMVAPVDLTKAACRAGCLVFRRPKLRSGCARLCKSFAGASCDGLAALCRHCMRHANEDQCAGLSAGQTRELCTVLIGNLCN
jgi:hypothetical protein